MKNSDSIIEQLKQKIKLYENLVDKSFPETEEEHIKVEIHKRKIAELKYRIKVLEGKRKDNSSILIPQYGDGKYASNYHKEALDILRVCYYKYFYQDPTLSPVPKRDMMFYDPTLFLPVKTFLVKGKTPFLIMFSGNYPNYKSDTSKSVSIELPFEILSKQENEECLKFMLELIKIYSGDSVNLVFGDGTCSKGTLSYIADKDFSIDSQTEKDYYEFFNRLCDNSIRNIVYIGDSITKGVKTIEIKKVKTEIINLHKRLTVAANSKITTKGLEKTNEKIKQRILTINKHL